jgi:hypothetical protein
VLDGGRRSDRGQPPRGFGGVQWLSEGECRGGLRPPLLRRCARRIEHVDLDIAAWPGDAVRNRPQFDACNASKPCRHSVQQKMQGGSEKDWTKKMQVQRLHGTLIGKALLIKRNGARRRQDAPIQDFTSEHEAQGRASGNADAAPERDRLAQRIQAT